MFKFLFRNRAVKDDKYYKNAIDKIFENSKEEQISIVFGNNKAKPKIISKKEFMKLMSL